MERRGKGRRNIFGWGKAKKSEQRWHGTGGIKPGVGIFDGVPLTGAITHFSPIRRLIGSSPSPPWLALSLPNLLVYPPSEMVGLPPADGWPRQFLHGHLGGESERDAPNALI
ncbi:hypothetical protein niasHT_015346 [Heterodera trifolii]|uniref:Uncharacterized protein n=1 Tax=Heterodera trifolii TaxID=157864 RepID=A0ABD2L022_9BILA